MDIRNVFSRVKEADPNPNPPAVARTRNRRPDGIGNVSRFFDTVGDIDERPQDLALQQLYINVYNNFGIVAKIIDATTEQVVQNFYFDGPNKEKFEELRKDLNLDRHLFRVCKTMLKHGSCWVEVVKSGDRITKLKLLPPEQMIVVRTIKGKLLAHVQVTPSGKKLVWGSINKNYGVFQSGSSREVGKLDNIMYYTFNRQAGEKYGTSIIRAAIRMLRIKDQVEGDLPKILQRYLAPVTHFMVGNEDRQPTQDQIESIRDDLKNIYADTEIVTDWTVQSNVLGFKDKGAVKIGEIMDVVDRDIMMAMGMFPVLTGKSDQGDTKSAEVQLRAEGRHIKAIQRELKTEFEDKFIIGQGLGSTDDQLMWELPDERESVEHIANVVQLFQAGLLTREKANHLLPSQFHCKIDDLEEEFGGMMNSFGQTPQQNLQNPNDPHQSTQMVSGQRVKRDDHRNPLDKKVKDTGKSKHEVTKK